MVREPSFHPGPTTVAKLLIGVLLTGVFAAAPPAHARTRMRGPIRFAKGQTVATLHGTVRKGHPECWTYVGRNGQEFSAMVTRGAVYFSFITGRVPNNERELDASIRNNMETGIFASFDNPDQDRTRGYACVATQGATSQRYAFEFDRNPG
jgi:hypothetical protein